MKESVWWTILFVCRAQCLPDSILHFALCLLGIITKVWRVPPPLALHSS